VNDTTALRVVRLVHTIAWALLGGCVIAIAPLAWTGRFGLALGLSLVVLAEVGVLAMNGWRCPLTPIAARYTTDRRPNFDIYLPQWLAQYNKEIFGSLYVAGLVVLLGRWFGWF
jgi:hypothetical protein